VTRVMREFSVVSLAFRYARGVQKAIVSLQSSEGLVYAAASRIYSAYVQLGKVSEGQQQDWMRRSLREAVELAQMTDQTVKSDAELD
jgi:hypothetical protein